MSETEYLLTEGSSSLRHEFVDGYVFEVSGSTQAHNLICGNLFYEIYGHLDGTGCRISMADLKVKIEEANSYYYPDIFVSCTELEPKSVFESKPVFIAEVLSPSTAQIDRREKLIAYGKIKGMKQYLIVFQDQQKIELFTKQDSNWELLVASGQEEFTLSSLCAKPLTLKVSSLYKGYNPPARVKEEQENYLFESN